MTQKTVEILSLQKNQMTIKIVKSPMSQATTETLRSQMSHKIIFVNNMIFEFIFCSFLDAFYAKYGIKFILKTHIFNS